MKIAFYRGKGKLFDRITRWFTNGEFSHVELVFGDGSYFSSSKRDKGMRFKFIKPKPDKWVLIELNVNNEHVLRRWCWGEVGKKYDTLGVIGFTVSPFRNRVQSRKRWYCSEICAAALRKAGGARYSMLPERISPSALYSFILASR